MSADITANNNQAIKSAILFDNLNVVEYLLNTLIYSKEDIQEYLDLNPENEDIHNLLVNYEPVHKECSYYTDYWD